MPDAQMPNPFDDDERPEGEVEPPRPADDGGDGGSSDDDEQPDDTGADGTLGDRVAD